jgi:hypothetical protein
VLLYLSNHGHQIHSVDLTGGEDGTICIRQLPSNLRQLNSLQLKGFNLQFRPGINGFKGVLESIAATAALKQLRLSDCRMLDIGGSLKAWQALSAVLSQQSDSLEHLQLKRLTCS